MQYRRTMIYPNDGYFQDVSGDGLKPKNSHRIHIILFLSTVLTTTVIGALMADRNPFTSLTGFASGFPFSLTLLGILGVHEFAHYFAARSWNINVTLPYFIPLPLPTIGTLGAVIRMKSSLPNRKALVDVGSSGPIAGFIVALIASAVGLSMSEISTVSGPELEYSILLGESLIFKFISFLVIGDLPAEAVISLHPVAFAGWVGLFVTALNLIPVGQLDGGHILFAFSPRVHELLRRIRVPLLILMGILFWEGWYVWAVLSLLFGRSHPYPNRMEYSIGPSRTAMGIISLLIFILCMTPIPVLVG
ncbi:site-2 protease family protein [Candidatus Omnitrophota bacterium]